MTAVLERISHGLEWFEENTKRLFVLLAIVAYLVSLVILAQKVSPVADLDRFLVKALGNLSLPFGIILLQELLELLNSISRSTLSSTVHQFEIVALVILRSFFKDFYKLNKAVMNSPGILPNFTVGGPVETALVKVVAIIAIVVLIFVFKRLSQNAGIGRRYASMHVANLWKQAGTLLLCVGVLAYMVFVKQRFDIMMFISLVFTGMIALDAVFFLWSIGQSHEFDMLMFDGGLVVSLILARFPLFAANATSYALAIVGVGFATAALRLFVRPLEQQFLGCPSEDSVSRQDFRLERTPDALDSFHKGLAAFMGICQATDRCVANVRLVCEELLSQIMEHEEEDDKGPGKDTVHVELAVYQERMTVTISTQGHAYNPLRQEIQVTSDAAAAELQPGGLGMHLVRMFSERVAYRREAGNNVITVLVLLDRREQGGSAGG